MNLIFNAFKFLLYDKAKSFGALMGVIISTFLIGQQVGVFIFLTNRMATLARLNPEYVWVIDNQTENVNTLGTLNSRIQNELASFQGVERVSPVFIGSARVQFPEATNSAALLVGLQAPDFAGGPSALDFGQFSDLLPEGAVCVDVFDKAIFPSTEKGTQFEINKRKCYIAARTRGVNSFGGSFIFTTIERARALCNSNNSIASAFLIKVKPGANKDALIKQIDENIFGVKAWKGEDLAKSSVGVVLKTTSIATSVGTLVIFALISGCFIIGLTLYSAAIDRMKDYGTMKAIGATNGYISRLIYSQAIIFATLGFGIGFMMINGFKQGVAKAGLLFEYPLWFLLTFMGVILFIALFGASFAARRINKLEPAEVFRF